MQGLISDPPAGYWVGPKLAGALTDPWRSRILMELAGRPMSPSEFAEEIGGDLSYIARCFRQLAEWGYAEIIEERPGRRRGAAVEHVYRAIQRAHFDTATWEGLPRFQRDVVSDSILGSYFNRVTQAIEAGTFDQDLDRHLSWDGVVLDRHAWGLLVAELDRLLTWMSEDLQVQASKRLATSDEEPIITTASLASFRSPRSPATVLQTPRRQEFDRSQHSPANRLVSVEMAKAMRNRWRSRILMELNARPLSPSQFVEEVGGSPTHISRCFRQLAEWGYIEIIAERPGGRRGGGVELVYRNIFRAYFDTPTWETLPHVFRCEFSNSILGSYLARVSEAIKAGTFDAEKDRHLSWLPLTLDRESWIELTTQLDELLEWLPSLESQALKRAGGALDDLIPTTVGLSAFRSPSRSKDKGTSPKDRTF
jgi:hypothetical protein